MIWTTAVILLAQPAVTQFEVASVKPSVWRPNSAAATGRSGSGGGGSGGGGGVACPESFHMDPGRVDIVCGQLTTLIAYAFRIPVDHVTGPDWFEDQRTVRFDIRAKLPSAATEAQVPEMLQALLADRFKLTTHRATTERPIYALVVARSGLKVKEASPHADVVEPSGPSSSITQFGGVPP